MEGEGSGAVDWIASAEGVVLHSAEVGHMRQYLNQSLPIAERRLAVLRRAGEIDCGGESAGFDEPGGEFGIGGHEGFAGVVGVYEG